MAIVSIREGYSGNQAGGEADSKTSVRRFSMTTDDTTDDARFSWPQSDPTDPTIIIPKPGTFYPEWTDIRSKEPQVKKISPCFFNVEVQYAKNITDTGEEKEDDFAADPLSKPAEESWDSTSVVEPVTEDINGLPYRNIFNEHSEREREFFDEVLHLTRNEAAFDEYLAFTWLNTVYNGTFRGAARGRALMKRIGVNHIKDEVIDSSTFGDVLYSRVSYEIHFRHRGVPLINAYAAFNDEGYYNWYPIADNEYNQALLAWWSRRLHIAKICLDGDGNRVPLSEERPIRIMAPNRGIQVPENEIGDFIFQQEYQFATWPGVA